MPPALHFLPAVELAGKIRAKEVSARELLDHFWARVEAHNPALNAIIWNDIEDARQRADEADRALAAGQLWGPLHGLPMTIKESYNLVGAPTTWGLPELEHNIAEEDALTVQRLKAAGANIFGKTNVPLLLSDWQSFNVIYGTTNNPWDLSKTPGGSSGGSTAALAAGMTGLEIGSDIGASIRNPAHYCGVFGLKPTYGVIPPRGQALPGSVTPADISVVGPLARSGRDLSLAFEIMAGADLLDEHCWSLTLDPCLKDDLKDFRIAVKLSDPNSEVEAAYATRLKELADKLADAGATVEETEPEIDTLRLFEVYILLLRAATSDRLDEEAIAHWRTIAEELGLENDSYEARMARGNLLPHRDWLKLHNERNKVRFAFESFFQDWDILLCPAAAGPAWPHDQEGERHDRTIEVNGKQVPTTDQLFWAGYSGVTYLPSTVGPCGFVEGDKGALPVGYQAISGHGRDKTCLTFTELVEESFGGFAPPPGYD